MRRLLEKIKKGQKRYKSERSHSVCGKVVEAAQYHVAKHNQELEKDLRKIELQVKNCEGELNGEAIPSLKKAKVASYFRAVAAFWRFVFHRLTYQEVAGDTSHRMRDCRAKVEELHAKQARSFSMPLPGQPPFLDCPRLNPPTAPAQMAVRLSNNTEGVYVSRLIGFELNTRAVGGGIEHTGGHGQADLGRRCALMAGAMMPAFACTAARDGAGSAEKQNIVVIADRQSSHFGRRSQDVSFFRGQPKPCRR